MIRLGKTYSNIMIDLQLTNAKLVERAKNIIMTICDVDYAKAEDILQESDGHVKTAIVMTLAGVSADTAKKRLELSNGFVRAAIDENFNSY